ncbi:hypothetical protein B0H19DRAFT_1071252 [Mycena capillaripes]|nr:hypothetical protein B0H19DRAFT_1071252 [Mycena capillaripes]
MARGDFGVIKRNVARYNAEDILAYYPRGEQVSFPVKMLRAAAGQCMGVQYLRSPQTGGQDGEVSDMASPESGIAVGNYWKLIEQEGQYEGAERSTQRHETITRLAVERMEPKSGQLEHPGLVNMFRTDSAGSASASPGRKQALFPNASQ